MVLLPWCHPEVPGPPGAPQSEDGYRCQGWGPLKPGSRFTGFVFIHSAGRGGLRWPTFQVSDTMKNDIISHPVLSWDNQQQHYCGFGKKKKKIWRVWTSRGSNTDRNHKEALESLVKVVFHLSSMNSVINCDSHTELIIQGLLPVAINACCCDSWARMHLNDMQKTSHLAVA